MRTRLELATPGVTGRYSNRLNYRTSLNSLEGNAKIVTFSGLAIVRIYFLKNTYYVYASNSIYMSRRKNYKSMKLLIINASPRKNGNISKRLLLMHAEAERAGVSVFVENAQHWNIRPCIGCMKCRSSKYCILPEDDSQRVLALIQECDAMIIGSPCYWGNMPGTLKLLFDRIVYGLMDENGLAMPVPLHKGKKALIVCTSSTPWPFNILMGQTSGTVRAIKEVIGTAGFKVSTIQRGGTKNRPAITEREARRCQKAVRRLISR